MRMDSMKATVLAAVLAVLASGLVRAQDMQVCEARPKITVNGEAMVNVAPDKIVITFGIETSDNDIGAAKQKNTDILVKAVAAARECGVPEKEIQTDYLSIQPRWRNEYAREGFLGYFVRNTFVVTLTEPSKVEDLVTRVLQAGVNYIHGIDFQTTELKKYREQARELALEAAREKADKMAAVLGQSVGSPIQINESYGGSPWWYYSSWSGWGYGGRSSGMSQNVVQDVQGGRGEGSETIALGKISIRAGVAVTFELRKQHPWK
jgi:uncharacterized protein YggE